MTDAQAGPAEQVGRRADLVIFIVFAALLALAVTTGGSSQQSGPGAAMAVWLALPAIAWGALRLLQAPLRVHTLAWLALALLLLAIPALQLLPLPGALSAGPARAVLAADLAAFGVPPPAHISLVPAATADALFALLPPLALFLLCIGMPAAMQRRAAAFVVMLALASLVLGIVQLGAPQESALNPFPQWQPAMGGIFANPNHQATLLVVASVFATGVLGSALRARGEGPPVSAALVMAAAFVLLLCIVAVPLTGSRAGVVILVVACAAVAAAQWAGAGQGPRRWLLAVAGVLMLAGAWIAARWMQVDAIDELRGPLRDATAGIAKQFAPAGSGVGSFVPVFEQHAPAALLADEYINHAHNEYLQWWLEAGVLAPVAMGLGAIVLVLSTRALWRLPSAARGTGVAALVALLAVLAHSVVDYPLRTPAMLAVAAVLAGLVAGQGLGLAGRERKRPTGQTSRIAAPIGAT